MYKIYIYVTLSKLHVRRKEKAVELQMETYLAIKDEEGKKIRRKKHTRRASSGRLECDAERE